MATLRLIPRLDIKGSNLIKGIQMEGVRVLGDPREFASSYYQSGADELLYMDVVASLYGRDQLLDIVRHTAANIFIPITAGGGVRSVDDAAELLRAGADKIAINTAAVSRPELISEMAHHFGSQCMVLSIEAKQAAAGKWLAYTDNGRENSGIDVVEWAIKGVGLGAGEILLTSVDREGTRRGFDTALVQAVRQAVPVPMVVSGGMGKPEDLTEVVLKGGADAVAMADILHYKRSTLAEIRQVATDSGIQVRCMA